MIERKFLDLRRVPQQGAQEGREGSKRVFIKRRNSSRGQRGQMGERKVYYKIDTNRGKKMIVIMNTPGSQKGSPAPAEERSERSGMAFL